MDDADKIIAVLDRNQPKWWLRWFSADELRELVEGRDLEYAKKEWLRSHWQLINSVAEVMEAKH